MINMRAIEKRRNNSIANSVFCGFMLIHQLYCSHFINANSPLRSYVDPDHLNADFYTQLYVFKPLCSSVAWSFCIRIDANDKCNNLTSSPHLTIYTIDDQTYTLLRKLKSNIGLYDVIDALTRYGRIFYVRRRQ